MTRISDSEGWYWGWKFGFFIKFSGEAAPGGPGATLWEALYWKGPPKTDGEFVHRLKTCVFTAEKPSHWAKSIDTAAFPETTFSCSLAQAHQALPRVHQTLPHAVFLHTCSLCRYKSLSGEILLFLYWVNSHSSVKILLECHFLHETITGSFRNSIFLSLLLCASDLEYSTSHFLKNIFLMWTFEKVFTEFVATLLPVFL